MDELRGSLPPDEVSLASARADEMTFTHPKGGRDYHETKYSKRAAPAKKRAKKSERADTPTILAALDVAIEACEYVALEYPLRKIKKGGRRISFAPSTPDEKENVWERRLEKENAELRKRIEKKRPFVEADEIGALK